MTVQKLTTISNWSGLSSDTKPTDGPAGSTFFETDTRATFFWNDAAWSSASVGAIDTVTYAITTVDYEHHEVHGGSHYFVTNYANLTINQVLDFTWLMPNTTKWAHWTWDITTESETLWHVYENGTATNPLSNTVTPLNNNRNSANTSGTTMKSEIQTNLAGANADTDVSGAILLEQGISGSGKQSGGQDKRGHELILKQNTLYVLRAVATAAGYIDFNMQWYEHTNKE